MKRSLFFFFLVAGCSSAPRLTQDGESVNLVDQLSVSEAAKYDKVSPIACENNSVENATENIARCRIELRNKAAFMGADLVVVDGKEIGTPSCQTCIRLNGYAYRSR